MSYNLCDGGGDRVGAIGAMLRHQQADVIGLVEANDRANVEALGQALGMQVAYGEAMMNPPAAVAWLSRLPMRSARNHRLSALAKTLLQVEVMWSGVPVHLFVTHLADRREEVAHPHTAEVQAILRILRSVGPEPHLLVGDFNAVAPGDPVGDPPPGVAKTGDAFPDAPRCALQNLLDAGYLDCYRARHPHRPGYTYPAAGPWLRLDYAFASPGMADYLVDCDIVRSAKARRASDHLPVIARFERPSI